MTDFFLPFVPETCANCVTLYHAIVLLLALYGGLVSTLTAILLILYLCRR